MLGKLKRDDEQKWVSDWQREQEMNEEREIM